MSFFPHQISGKTIKVEEQLDGEELMEKHQQVQSRTIILYKLLNHQWHYELFYSFMQRYGPIEELYLNQPSVPGIKLISGTVTFRTKEAFQNALNCPILDGLNIRKKIYVFEEETKINTNNNNKMEEYRTLATQESEVETKARIVKTKDFEPLNVKEEDSPRFSFLSPILLKNIHYQHCEENIWFREVKKVSQPRSRG